MNEQLTAPTTTRHTNNMEERGESTISTEVGKIIDRADALAHGLEILGDKIKEATKKEDGLEKQEAERKIREELDQASISERQERRLTDVISTLSREEQVSYKRMFGSIQDPQKREKLLQSIQTLIEDTNEPESLQEDEGLTINEIHDETTLNKYLDIKISPQVHLLKRNAIEHIRKEGVKEDSLIQLSQDIDSAFDNEKSRLTNLARKGEWKKVTVYLKRIESDISSRLRHFGLPGEGATTQNVDENKKVNKGGFAKELLEAEIKQHVAAAADRFKDGEKRLSPNTVLESKGKLGIDPEIVYENASLTREEDSVRLNRAESILKKSLNQEEKKAILEAHYYGVSEDDGNGKSVYTYSVPDLRHKYQILNDAGLNKDQIRKLMEYGITGMSPNIVDIPQSVNDLLNTAPYVSSGEGPFSDHKRDEQINRKTYARYGGMEDYYSFDNLEKQNAEIVQREAGRTIVDDVSELEDSLEYQLDSPSQISSLQAEMYDSQTFSIKGFNRRFLGELLRLHTLSNTLPGNVQESFNSSVDKLGTGLQKLYRFQEQRGLLEKQLNELRDQYWLSDGSSQVKREMNQIERMLQTLESQFKTTSLPLITELNEATNTALSYSLATKSKNKNRRRNSGRKIGGSIDGNRSEYEDNTGWGGDDDGNGGSGAERGGHGNRGGDEYRDGGGDGDPPRGLERLRGRGEGEESEEDPFGRSVRSIEDLGYFMERVTAEFKGKIMTAVYRGNDNTLISEEKLLEGITDEREKEELKEKRKLYAYKVSQGEYARDYENLKARSGEQGKNKVLMLTKDEIVTNYYDMYKYIQRDESGNIRRVETEEEFKARIGVRPSGQNPKDYWESVQLVKPDEFMNWIRHYWTIVHGDDPDNPSMNFFAEIVVNHPDQRGAVNAGQMHKNAGAFLRSRFLTDPTTGELRVFEKLKDEIINEVWVPSGERNKEIFYKKVMHSDEELPKQMASQVTADNLMAKTAAGGKNTMEMFFTLPERFKLDFDPITGETISEKMRDDDIGFGRGMLLAYEMYYNISDIKGLQDLLGKDASIFNREFITRAVLEVIGSDMPEDLNSPVLDENGNNLGYNYYELARRELLVTDEEDNGTIIDEDLYEDNQLKIIYDENGKIKIKDNPTLRRWLIHLNPYYPAQKDDILLNVIRKVVENQMQEITGIEKNAETSGLAEFHAYYRTYHDGIASRHDVGMGNRNSQSKYEFLGAPGGYQDKQLGRDRAGNLYTKGIIWGPTVGVLNAMPTRNGETVHDILSNAVQIQLRAGEAYRSLLNKAKRGEIEGININLIRKRLSDPNPQDIEGDVETNKILHEIRKLDQDIEEIKEKGMSTLVKQKSRERYTLVQKALETRLRNSEVCPELAEKWTYFKENKDSAYKSSSEVLARLRFDEVQYAQYGGMHYNNSTALFHMIMNSQDLPMDKIAGRDYEGKVYFKPSEFGAWLEESEKRMRYTIETWPLPLGSMIRKLVNPRQNSEVPQYVDMPVIESVFGSYDYTGARNGGVMGMAQKMINRELRKKGKNPIMFTDGKGNIVPVEPKVDPKTGEFMRDKLGNIQVEPDWESNEALYHRDNLRDIVGYIHYGENNEILGYQKGILDDPAKYFTRAFVKVQIADQIMSHTDKASPYEKWTVHQREEFFHALELSNYFSEEDIEDIREFSDNDYWVNFRREISRSLRREGLKGLLESFKFFFSSSLK